MESFLKNHEHTIKMLILLFAASFTLIQYLEYKREETVQRTIKLNEVAYRYNVVNSRSALEQALLKEKEEITLFFNNLDEKYDILDDPKYKQETLGYIASIVEKYNIEAKVLAFFDFYTMLQNCVDTGICDEKTAKTMYASNRRDIEILDTYCAYVLYYRQLWRSPDYAKKALAFGAVESCKW